MGIIYRRISGLVAVLAMLAVNNVAVQAQDWDDIESPYLQRIDTLTTSSGNAQRVNTVTHLATPWPHGVRNRKVPVSAARMIGAIQRYQDGNKQRLPVMRKPEDKAGYEMPLEAPINAEANARPTVSAGGGGAANTPALSGTQSAAQPQTVGADKPSARQETSSQSEQ